MTTPTTPAAAVDLNEMPIKPNHLSADPDRQREEIKQAITTMAEKIGETDARGIRARDPISVQSRVAMEKIIYAYETLVRAEPARLASEVEGLDRAAIRVCKADGNLWEELSKTYNGRQQQHTYRALAAAALSTPPVSSAPMQMERAEALKAFEYMCRIFAEPFEKKGWAKEIETIRAALKSAEPVQAISPQGVPDGHITVVIDPAKQKVVPIEPTEEMIRTGWIKFDEDLGQHLNCRLIFQAMLSAAPEAKKGGE